MKLSLLSKSLLMGAVLTAILSSAQADSNRGGRDRGGRDGHSSHYDHGSHGDRRGNYYRSRGYYGGGGYYGRGYYGGGYGFGYPYYFGQPRTTIAVGLGSGYYGTDYVGSYGRDDDDRPIYRGKQISENTSSSLEISVQRKLNRLGYYKGSIDGSVGPATRSAISRYQRDNDLAETGRIDRSLVSSLGVS